MGQTEYSILITTGGRCERLARRRQGASSVVIPHAPKRCGDCPASIPFSSVLAHVLFYRFLANRENENQPQGRREIRWFAGDGKNRIEGTFRVKGGAYHPLQPWPYRPCPPQLRRLRPGSSPRNERVERSGTPLSPLQSGMTRGRRQGTQGRPKKNKADTVALQKSCSLPSCHLTYGKRRRLDGTRRNSPSPISTPGGSPSCRFPLLHERWR